MIAEKQTSKCEVSPYSTFRDGSRERRFAVIDVTDGADVAVRPVSLEHLLGRIPAHLTEGRQEPGSTDGSEVMAAVAPVGGQALC